MQDFEELEEQKKIIIESSMSEPLKKLMIRNIDWSILSIALDDTEDNRRKYRDLVSDAIHKMNPNEIKYISKEEVSDEINYFMVNHWGTEYKSVYVVFNEDEFANYIVLFYETLK